jgi:uncharacterized protein YdbL (DUF1318 family)
MIRMSRRQAFKTFAAVAITGALMCASALHPVWAQSLEALRLSGALGERYDGLAVVRQPSADADRLAAEINAQRQSIYKQRAAEQGVSADQVGRVYARQIFDQAPKGTWFLTEQGWVQK